MTILESLQENKKEILMAIIVTQNELQRVLNTSNLSAWDRVQEEQRLLQGLIHLKETLFEINLKEYQESYRSKSPESLLHLVK